MKIIAHRCGPAVYPGQTILSARQARAYAELIEIDTRFTADDVIVVSHDRTAERVFGDPRAIAELTAVEFLALRHRADPAFASHTLADFLCADVGPILIHVKEGGGAHRRADGSASGARCTQNVGDGRTAGGRCRARQGAFAGDRSPRIHAATGISARIPRRPGR
ncbi:MAG: hypothetical protein IJC93_09965 [Clostridia bacterium]|nr:hypothetical protein [Clostridia bacterium]